MCKWCKNNIWKFGGQNRHPLVMFCVCITRISQVFNLQPVGTASRSSIGHISNAPEQAWCITKNQDYLICIAVLVAITETCVWTWSVNDVVRPDNWARKIPYFSQYCFDEGYLHTHRHYREEVTTFGCAGRPGDDFWEYCCAAYMHFIYWQQSF